MQISRKNKGAVADSMTLSREGVHKENFVESHSESVQIDSNRIHNYSNDHLSITIVEMTKESIFRVHFISQ